jgi:hypothetical protein
MIEAGRPLIGCPSSTADLRDGEDDRGAGAGVVGRCDGGRRVSLPSRGCAAKGDRHEARGHVVEAEGRAGMTPRRGPRQL